MSSNAGRNAVRRVKPLAGERAIAAELSRQTRQDNVAPTSGKKPIPTSGMAKVNLSPATRWEPWTEMPTPPPIDDAVDERHIRLGVTLDAGIERVFLAEVAERLVVASGPPEIIERTQISAHRERAGVIRGNDNSAHARFPSPTPRAAAVSSRTIASDTALSACGRLSVTRPAAPRRFEQEIVRRHALAHR